jgi:tetratricopeptide (TPR) repeat protein
MTAGDPDANVRERRQLAETAVAQAARGELIDLGGDDADAYNRLGKALAELDRPEEALAAYQSALERDKLNRIAERNIERLEALLTSDTGPRGDKHATRAPAALFIEEMGKTGAARLINLAPARQLAPLSAGDAIELKAADGELEARVRGIKVGQVEPRVANRLLELMANGNRYEAALTHVEDEDLRLIIRETFAHPSNFGRVSFPGAAAGRSSDVRPYMKGTALRYDDEEESEEVEEEPEEVEELDTTLPELSSEPDEEEELLEEN